MTIKRLILIVLTLVAVFRVVLSLLGSLNQPQVQSRLELYQTNLILHVAEYVSLANEDNSVDLATALIGTEPYKNATLPIEKARQVAADNISLLQERLIPSSSQEIASKDDIVIASTDKTQQEVKKVIAKEKEFIALLDLNLGILQAMQGETQTAINTWKDLSSLEYADTAKVLQNLWTEPPQVLPLAESKIQASLEGWFRYQALKQLYQVEKKQEQLLQLKEKEQQIGQNAIVKLAVIGGIPFIGGITGLSLLIILLVQLLVKKDSALLAVNSGVSWETPWNGEIIWQVLIVGFFFIGEILLPLLFGLSGFNPVGLSLRLKAVYVLVSYLLMAGGGLLVLYFSLKPFFPLPKEWFQFRLLDNWFFWGLGGYLVALPLVAIVSVINQQLWQGQGGSNPLLSLALQAQDKLVLAIFFTTASIAAPIFEEIIFRGFLLASLTRYFPVGGAIVISGLIFATAHLSFSEVLPLTTLGIILGFVYTRSRNILAPIFLHSLWNSGTLLSLFVLGSNM